MCAILFSKEDKYPKAQRRKWTRRRRYRKTIDEKSKRFSGLDFDKFLLPSDLIRVS